MDSWGISCCVGWVITVCQIMVCVCKIAGLACQNRLTSLLFCMLINILLFESLIFDKL